MTFVDRYWEWRRRRALRAQERGQGRARERNHELTLVVDALIERRGFSRLLNQGDEPVPGTGEAAATIPHPDHAPAANADETPRPPGRTAPGPQADRQANGVVPETAGEHVPDDHGAPAILAAVDGTASSAEVGRHAVLLAASLRAKLLVLGFVNVAPASRAGIHRRLALAELERDSRAMAERTQELAGKNGVECEARWAPDSNPARAIVAAAEEVEACCVVIGSPGASVVDRLLDRAVGGVHGKVLRRARCPVLSVR